ncbi:alginate export family protein [Novipirellula rosea]|uniref:Alginate export family protein n=1 Tax=Novipirellula rosea TaxID=1031540 RepID=A0ABP8MP85_9BACT
MMTLPKRRRSRAALLAALSTLFTLNAAQADPYNNTGILDSATETVFVEPAVRVVSDTVDTAAEAIAPDEAAPLSDTAVYPEALPAPADDTSAPCGCCNSTCCKKQQRDAATEKMKKAYGGVFYANDFSYLNDPCYNGPSFFGDSLKGLADGKLDLGGEVRVRYHDEDGMRGLGLTGRDDEFWLTRLRLFSDYRMNDYIRLYGEYLYADSGGEFFDNRPIEENRGEIQNLFADVNLFSDGSSKLTARVGRQELLYGNQRLISPLDWANTRRTFEGGRLLYSNEDWNVDGFFVHPVNRNAATESKIDDANESVDFFGTYLTRKGLDIGTLDMYYLGLDDSTNNFDYHTLGSRVAGSNGDLLYEFEGGVQFGSNSNGSSHDAGFFTGGLGRKLKVADWKPTVWFWYDYASGGDADFVARGDDAFDHQFPLAHKYNGFMDLYGRRNLHDINMQFITPVLGPNVNLLVWYHYFLLDTSTTPYGVTMQPYNTTALAEDKELGHEIDVAINVNLNPRSSMLIGYSRFFAGDYYDETPGVLSNEDAQFVYTQFQTRF